jgi:hypothetical protein
MIGIILLFISWIILRFRKEGLTALGFNHPKQRTLEFSLGFFVAATFATMQFVATAYFANFSWVLNPNITALEVAQSFRWNINSVLYEDLLFRGVLLYLAIKVMGPKFAIALSAISFGIYHWFSYEVLGMLIPMIYVFLLTATFGAVMAYAFYKTKSIFLPIALHFGWNLVNIMLFSNGPLKSQILIPTSKEVVVLSTQQSLLISIGIPAVFLIFVMIAVSKIYKSR